MAKAKVERGMGTKARRRFVADQPCAACGRLFASQNAHLLGNGGLSRKKDCTTIGPLCGPDFTTGYIGCHELYDEHRSEFDEAYPDFDAEAVAAKTEAGWQLAREYSGE